MTRKKITLKDIYEAQKTISTIVKRTPLLPSDSLSQRTGCNVYYKPEFLQDTGSFKVRGAANVILHLNKEQLDRGVVTYSTGNHGKATAHIAKKAGSKASICLSRNVPLNKRKGVEMAGGELVIHGNSQDEATKHALYLSDEKGYTVIDPINDPYTISGHGTIGLEIFEDLPQIKTILVPVSGGALISGIALALKLTSPDIKIYGISMNRGAAMYESQKRGKPVVVEEVESLADSLQGGILLNNKYTFEMVNKYVDDLILVTEEEIEQGITYAFKHDHLVLEGAAAVGIAALLAGKVPIIGNNIAIVTTGSNIDNDLFLSVIEKNINNID